MNLVKWIRKNQMRLMVWLVVIIMISFVGGTALQKLLTSMGHGQGSVIGTYHNKGKIRYSDLEAARGELSVLQNLRADVFLLYMQQDLGAKLLGYLLFPESQIGPQLNKTLKEAVLRGELIASMEDIDGFFRPTQGNCDIYWILLKTEALEAGCVVSEQEARSVLKEYLNLIYKGKATAAEAINAIIQNSRVPEEQILRIFADLLSIQMYAQLVMDNEDITINQLKSAFGYSMEIIETEFVKIPAEDFIDQQPLPTEQQLTEQFNRYKNAFAGNISDDNPCGFGYKLPARVQLEYLVMDPEDVKKQIPPVTSQEGEDYYRQNIRQFQYEEPADPNKPDGEQIAKTRTYAEVAEQISEVLLQDKTSRRCEMIISEARGLIDAGFANIDMEQATTEQLAKAAGSYEQAGQQLGQKHDLKISTGRTGLLSAIDITDDMLLRSLGMEGRSDAKIQLWRVVMSVKEAAGAEMGYFEGAKPKMWENIGPFRGRDKIALIRIIDARKECEPADINVSYDNSGVILTPDRKDKRKTFSVRENVIGDCKILSAMKDPSVTSAKSQADRLVELLNQKGWDTGLAEFNNAFSQPQADGQQVQQNPPAAEKYRIEKLSLPRPSATDIANMKNLVSYNPGFGQYANRRIKTKKQIEAFCAALPADKNELRDAKELIESGPDRCYYILKSIVRKPATIQDFNKNRGSAAIKTQYSQTGRLSLVHFRPENIINRMQYQSAKAKVAPRPGDNTLPPLESD